MGRATRNREVPPRLRRGAWEVGPEDDPRGCAARPHGRDPSPRCPSRWAVARGHGRRRHRADRRRRWPRAPSSGYRRVPGRRRPRRSSARRGTGRKGAAPSPAGTGRPSGRGRGGGTGPAGRDAGRAAAANRGGSRPEAFCLRRKATLGTVRCHSHPGDWGLGDAGTSSCGILSSIGGLSTTGRPGGGRCRDHTGTPPSTACPLTVPAPAAKAPALDPWSTICRSESVPRRPRARSGWRRTSCRRASPHPLSPSPSPS